MERRNTLLADHLKATNGIAESKCTLPAFNDAVDTVKRVVAAFRQTHPRVKITTHLFPAAAISEMVRTHQADIGMTLSLQNAETLQVSTPGF